MVLREIHGKVDMYICHTIVFIPTLEFSLILKSYTEIQFQANERLTSVKLKNDQL